MSIVEWLQVRGADLLAAFLTAALLVGGVWLGVPFLRDRIAEVFLYSFCCLTAAVLHTLWDLAVRSGSWLVYALRTAPPTRRVSVVMATRVG